MKTTNYLVQVAALTAFGVLDLFSIQSTQRDNQVPSDTTSARCEDAGDIKAPKYKVVRKSHTDRKPGYGQAIDISLKPDFFDHRNMLALSCNLGREFKDTEFVIVAIHDSRQKAKLGWGPEGATPRGWFECHKNGDCFIEWREGEFVSSSLRLGGKKIVRITIVP